ncbi:1,3-beta-glucanase [Acidipropionibacterium jensenii]|uniref:glycosyl hydrolase n=1 Tax=Acidipropionibacterium jensenii TaxID=1749 RepID=UPI000BC2D9FE|nr:glycosyl hydrolase [Acidipropionibacterium jensenii]AZZ42195.1 1,3-beta-glucanase [Acidipropionibacterium jensenii]
MTRSSRHLMRVATPALAFAMALSACSGSAPSPSPSSSGSGASASSANGVTALSAAKIKPLVSSIGSQAGADLKPARLASGLTPPTNKWFSGLVFGGTAQPVFPMPMSFGLSGAGFSFGLPVITSSDKTIMGGYRPSIQVGAGADSWQVTRYDEMSVTLTGRKGGSPIGTVTIAQGSPFITFTAAGQRQITTNLPFAGSGSPWAVQAGEDRYGLTGSEGVSVSGGTVTVPDRGHATFYVMPEGGDAATMAALAASPLKATASSYTLSGSTATTRLAYTTQNGSPTGIVALPHQQAGLVAGQSCDLGRYRSILGTLKLCRGTAMSWTTPTRPATAQLDLSGLDDTRRATLRKQVDADVQAFKPYPADTYFGSKALYRDAQLYTIAKQIGATSSATALRTRIVAQLNQWANPAGCGGRTSLCFYYDRTNRGIVGLTHSFGSEQFNDHHFHYGYFLYAAGVMAADDPSLVEKLRPVMTLLAADIASPSDTGAFPQRRNFDPYVSHSWASGTSPFADGNNQESASEAVNAWVGLGVWARAAGDSQLAGEATWMQALESASSLAYWTNFDTKDPVYKGFNHSITPLVWGGKRDYATWFSPEPAAALAILLIPMNPSSGYLGSDPARVRVNLGEALGSRGYRQTYGDLLLLYSALQGSAQRDAAIGQVPSLTSIDDSLTRSYILAYLYSLT